MESDEIKRKRMEKFLKKKENLDNIRSNFNQELPTSSLNTNNIITTTQNNQNNNLINQYTSYDKPSSTTPSSNKNYLSIFKKNQNIEKKMNIYQSIKSICLIVLSFLILLNCK